MAYDFRVVGIDCFGSGSALQSSNTNAALVPTSALVPEGQTAATFPIETKVVTATTNVTIGATYGVTSRSATLTVQAPAGNYVSSLTISPLTLTGGSVATGMVTLKSTASGNIAVSLASSEPAVAIVPASVTVKNKKSDATFTVTTFSVATQTPVTITASYGGVIQRVHLTVNPQFVAADYIRGSQTSLPCCPSSAPIHDASREMQQSRGYKPRPQGSASTPGAEPIARCASLALTPCLMSAAVPRKIAATAGIEQSRYNLYTPELTLLAETETTAASAKAIAWEYVFFGGEPLAQIATATGEVHWYFTDHLGTPVVTTDAAAAVDWSAQREPYGLSVSTMGDRHQPVALPGQEGAEEGPYYNNFRWYGAPSGRYSQADPIGIAGGTRMPLNHLFAYGSANPVSNSDPSGLYAVSNNCDSKMCGPPSPGLCGSHPGAAVCIADQFGKLRDKILGSKKCQKALNTFGGMREGKAFSAADVISSTYPGQAGPMITCDPSECQGLGGQNAHGRYNWATKSIPMCQTLYDNTHTILEELLHWFGIIDDTIEQSALLKVCGQ